MKKTPLIHSFFVAMFCLFAVLAQAQGAKMPDPIKETFSTQYPQAADVSYRDNLVSGLVLFTQNGEKYAAYYTKKGVWKSTEKDWTFDQLPADVKDGFSKSKFADWKVDETKIIYRPGGTERYRLKATKSDLQKRYLYFNKNGQLVEDNMTL
jgi:hypothetical protein